MLFSTKFSSLLPAVSPRFFPNKIVAVAVLFFSSQHPQMTSGLMIDSTLHEVGVAQKVDGRVSKGITCYVRQYYLDQ